MRAVNVAELFATRGRALGELDEVWRALLANPDIAISLVRLDDDGEFRFVEANAAGQLYSVCPWTEIPGMTIKEALIPEVRDFLESKLQLCARTGEAQHYERSIDLPQGRVAWATNLIPVSHGDGEIREIVAMARPIPLDFHSTGIDERNRMLVEGLASTEPGLIYLYDPLAKRANFVAGQVEVLLGFKPYEMEEMEDPLATLIHPDDWRWVAGHVAEVIAHPCEKVSVFECRVRQKNGEYRLLSCHNRVLDRSANGMARTLIGIAHDVTDQRQLKQEVAELTSRLSTAQLEERRLIAQELHDSAGQYLVAAELALIGAQERSPELAADEGVRNSLGDVMHCLKDAQREIRVLSYLLHPPAIANQGLATVLRNFALGFGGRAGVAVDVSIDKKVDAAPNQLAIPLLRFCQEALTNVHRHAKASSVSVKLDVLKSFIVLEICDNGIGFAPRNSKEGGAVGLGLTGMRDRMEQLGGTLEVDSGRGTCLKATIPLP